MMTLVHCDEAVIHLMQFTLVITFLVFDFHKVVV